MSLEPEARAREAVSSLALRAQGLGSHFPAADDGSWGVWAHAGAATFSASNNVTVGTTKSVLVPNGNPLTAGDLNLENTPYCPNSAAATDPIFHCTDTDAAMAARSRHSGGVNACLADGSVHFISNNVDPNTWTALFTVAGGEVLGDF